jgi:cell division protein FtsN
MRNGVPYGIKFISRFFLEIVPAVLAAVIGGFLFAHYYTGSPSPEQSGIAAASAISTDGRAALVDEEHTQLLDFLKRGRAAAKPGDAAAGAAPPAKPRSVVTKEAATKESVVKVRRAPLPLVAEGQPKPQPAVVATSGPLLSAQPGSVASNPVPPADIPNVSPQAMAAPKVSPETAASGRAPADDKQAGVFGTVLSKASEIKDQAIDFVRDIPGRVLPPRDKTSDATVPGAPQRLSQTSPE